MESKALELMALQFTQFLEDNRDRNPAYLLRAGDIERIHRAKEILIYCIIST
ncbi:hypothetical protein IQ238_07785 [Pleurocapsales cyanobacterium LEGE 06147]|nr:hypothetical protein [Pleurocapsales cyanobacterium LEGE 06147]